MSNPNIVLATTTLYDSMENPRLPLALKTIAAAKACGYPFVVGDDSPKEVWEAIRRAGPNALHQAQKGMGPSRRHALRLALVLGGSDCIIVWLEPEKHTFVPLIDEVCAPFEEDPDLDLIIPRRRSLESYPPMQQLTEELGREGFRLATGCAFDSWFGPQAFRARVASYYLNYAGPPDLWDSIHVPAAQIIKAGHKVEEVVVDYQHPPEQLEENTLESYQKRVHQLATLSNALANNL